MGATTPEKENDIAILTGDLIKLLFDNEVAILAGEIYNKLRKTNKMIEFRDIFIAATCIINQHPLVTLNIKHFSRIEGLQIHS